MKLLNRWTIVDGRLVDPSGRQFEPDDLITAEQIESCLGIPSLTTWFFNHSGTVPASDVVREALDNGVRQRGGRRPGSGRPKTRPEGAKRRQIWLTDAEYAALRAYLAELRAERRG